MMQRLINRLIPFLFIGLAIVVLFFGLVLFAYLLLFGAAVGLTLFAYSWLKAKLFPKKMPPMPEKKSGRIIDSNDWKEL